MQISFVVSSKGPVLATAMFQRCAIYVCVVLLYLDASVLLHRALGVAVKHAGIIF